LEASGLFGFKKKFSSDCLSFDKEFAKSFLFIGYILREHVFDWKTSSVYFLKSLLFTPVLGDDLKDNNSFS